eukprot:12483443-Alexandrium_andersonii.AAC.1
MGAPFADKCTHMPLFTGFDGLEPAVDGEYLPRWDEQYDCAECSCLNEVLHARTIHGRCAIP